MSNSSTSKGNLLIVDDTLNNLRLLSSILSKQGYEVRCANKGTMALMAIETEQPDLILLDINMPELSGYAVCEQIKANEQTRDIPVIFLSALNEAIDKVQAFRVGGVDYIAKPFQVEEVLLRVENHLALRRLRIKLQQAEAEALKALAQEKELNRLKSEFVSMVSHDFRTPLTSIQGFAGLLRCQNQPLNPEMQNRCIDKIDAAVEHMLHLLDKVLLIGSIEAKKNQYQPECLNLEQFCAELTETLQLSVSSQHKIRFSCVGDCSQAKMDVMLLQQILTNLISNAIKYSADGKSIDFELEGGDVATFRIRDEGIGIPPEDQAHLFDTFYRCSNVGQIKGSGLGLAIVKHCVDAHQGHISVESIEAKGTTFTVTLPMR